MTESAQFIDAAQDKWAGSVPRDPEWHRYTSDLAANLFLKQLHADTKSEFQQGDGSELKDARNKPAKMRALASSSALAVNFFDPWRDVRKLDLANALELSSPIEKLVFEYKPDNYPVKPRAPNLDLMLVLENGKRVAIESKFSESYRSNDGYGALSARYFPGMKSLWDEARLPGAQKFAEAMRPSWCHLDAPQLLKHCLGLACDSPRADMLLYLWFDTGKTDAIAHQEEIECFTQGIANDAVAFRAFSYQKIFRALGAYVDPINGWKKYMTDRYFS